jgi:hypothetical protein
MQQVNGMNPLNMRVVMHDWPTPTCILYSLLLFKTLHIRSSSCTRSAHSSLGRSVEGRAIFLFGATRVSHAERGAHTGKKRLGEQKTPPTQQSLLRVGGVALTECRPAVRGIYGALRNKN